MGPIPLPYFVRTSRLPISVLVEAPETSPRSRAKLKSRWLRAIARFLLRPKSQSRAPRRCCRNAETSAPRLSDASRPGHPDSAVRGTLLSNRAYQSKPFPRAVQGRAEYSPAIPAVLPFCMSLAVCRFDFSRMRSTPTSAMIFTPGRAASSAGMCGVPFMNR